MSGKYDVNLGVLNDPVAFFTWLGEFPFKGLFEWNMVPTRHQRRILADVVVSFTEKSDAIMCKLTWGGAQ